ncbi:unnamed protein product [Brassicogethes aeneus]|uniref:CUB domain-containing protein n=1 Tax=Brassicogethes aeneus TaxID=1431903 RepID=A0A9P0B8F2_BRAAE|nr:unnamed protein product [Brassicogethes aeneus]
MGFAPASLTPQTPSSPVKIHLQSLTRHRIKLIFSSFELESHQECSYDRVDFYDGGSPETPTIGRYCGSRIPPMVVTTGNHLFVSFRSDSSVQRKGFQAHYSTACGGILQAVPDTVKSIFSHAKYGSVSYDNRADCDWTIESSPEYRVFLSFVTFDVEEEKDCGYDYVEVFNGLDSSGLSFGKLCGKTKPINLSSTHDGLLVRFRSDDTVASKGFHIIYEAIEEDSLEI